VSPQVHQRRLNVSSSLGERFRVAVRVLRGYRDGGDGKKRVKTEPAENQLPVITGFDGFHRAHRDRLYRALVLATRDPDTASEAVDEAMARAAERWNVIASYDCPEGWVYRVALNWARSVFRRRLRPVPADADLTWDALPDPDVSRAVERLPYKFRVVVVARYYLDWSMDQIAEGLEVPVGTVKSRLHRAHTLLKRELGSTP